MNKLEFIKKAKENPVALEHNLYYIVIKTNRDNINMTDKFAKQLEDEGKLGKYIGFIDRKCIPPYDMEMLPIYGLTNRYETKHIYNTKEEVIEKDLVNSELCLLSRLS